MNPQICSNAIKCEPYRCCCLECRDKVRADVLPVFGSPRAETSGGNAQAGTAADELFMSDMAIAAMGSDCCNPRALRQAYRSLYVADRHSAFDAIRLLKAPP